MRILAALGPLLTLATCPVPAQEVVPATAEAPADAPSRDLERIRQMVRSLGPRASTPAQLVQLTRELPPAAAASLFLEVGEGYLRSGKWDLGGAVLMQLVEQYADEQAATDATLLLVRLYSSGEVAHSQRELPDHAQALRLPSGWSQQQSPADDKQLPTGMPRYALAIATRQLQKRAELGQNSPLAFQCTVAARRAGLTDQTKSWLSLLKHKRDAAEWRLRARAEDWLAEGRKGEPPVAATHCPATDHPPRLDGVLTDSCWQSATIVNPQSTLRNSQSTIRLTRDAKHLYLSAQCQKTAGVEYVVDPRPRTYDADLSGHDQVRLWLDVDRDYVSAFQLTIDHRGWTGDRCWLDAGWNPKWFVAVAGDEQSWTIEAAIPWAELAATPPRPGDAWAVAAERAADGADNAAAEFGLLLFD